MSSEDTPADAAEAFEALKREGRIPKKSRPDYYREYGRYMLWKKGHSYAVNCNTEAILGLYLNEKAAHVVPTSLISILSMLKAVIAVKHKKIVQTDELQRMLAQNTKDYMPKKTPVLTRDQMALFMRQTDEKYLVPKVITAIGMCGALRKSEMYALKLSDVTVTGGVAVIKVAPSKTNMRGSFAIAATEDNQDYLAPFLKYYELRIQITDKDPFLLQVRNGKCTRQRVGEHSIAKVPALVAILNGLPDPEK